MQRVFLGEKELVQVDKHAVKHAGQQEEENAKSVADVVVCALVEDAEGVEKDPAHVLPTSESRTRKLD